MGLVPQCSYRQGASTDAPWRISRFRWDQTHQSRSCWCNTTYLGDTVTLTWRDLRSTFKIGPPKIKKHMDRCGLTGGTRWCQNYSPSFNTWEVNHEQTFPQKTYFFPLVTSRTYSIRLTANLRAQIDIGDPGLSFGYLTILPTSIVVEIIAIFCEKKKRF